MRLTAFASALRSRLGLVSVPNANGSITHSLLFKNGTGLGGVEVGSMVTRNGQVRYSRIADDMKGRGLGKKLYGEVMRRMPGQTLEQGASPSSEARAVWESLQRRGKGYRVRKTTPLWGEGTVKASLPGSAAARMSSTIPRLTFSAPKVKTIEFRQREKEQPSALRRVMSVLAPAAIVGGTLGYIHYNKRPKVFTAPKNPSAPGASGNYAPHVPKFNHSGPVEILRAGAKVPNEGVVLVDHSVNRSTKWVRADAPFGKIPKAAPASIFRRTPSKAAVQATGAEIMSAPVTPATPAQKAAALTVIEGGKSNTPKSVKKSGREKAIAAIVKQKEKAGWTYVGKPLKTPAKSKAKTKTKTKTNLSSILRLTQFNEQNDAVAHMWGASDAVMTAYRKGRRIVPWVRRGTQVVEDSADIASGRKVKDPFYKKGWFKSAAVGAAIASPIFAARKINALHHQDAKFPNSIPVVHPVMGRIYEKALKAGRSVDRKWVASKAGRKPILTGATPFFSAKQKVTELAVLDDTAIDKGWTLRDARGKSARIYAPGVRRRNRREKSPTERVENIRAMRNVAAVAALAGLGGTLFYRHRLNQATGKPSDLETLKRIGKAVPFPVPHAMSAKLRMRQFGDYGDAPFHRVVDATRSNINRPNLPGESEIRAFADAPSSTKKRLLKGLLLGTTTVGGLYLGEKINRPWFGALAGAGAGAAALQ